VQAPYRTIFREIHLPSHDNINVVLLQVMGQDHGFNAKGYAGVGPLITIVGNAAAERAFFDQALGMKMLTENLLGGPEVEKMVGLPVGAKLAVSIWGAKGQHFGQMELIEYQGVAGADRYPLATPPATGVLHVNYQSDVMSGMLSRLSAAGTPWTRTAAVDVLPGKGDVVSVRSPAGLRIDIFAQ